MGFLTDLVGTIRRELDERPLQLEELDAAARSRPPARSLPDALRGATVPAVIAEVKRASPSAGAIDAHADPSALARVYESGGAAAISVLTEPRYFGGSLADLGLVCAAAGIPVLRKDFLIDPDQLVEARAEGADSVLLIAACLDDELLEPMITAARALGMEPLLETHSDDDLERALATDAEIVGINARDLQTLEVDVPAALGRLRSIPPGRIAVFESGIAGQRDVAAAVAAGASAILVGEALMRAADPAAAIAGLVHGPGSRLAAGHPDGDQEETA
ncbi:MAG: indole-3-glycerol phosphate synthase TrpC [Actinomycetota bacterium]|nr:indole-3-glycerol phosphate synthase TrpC [Actinomycetota bacterium]